MSSISSASSRQVVESSVNSSASRRSRVRTGCITCKIRRIKCDETKPSCKRCTNTGRRCDGYDAPDLSRTALIRALQRGELLNTPQYGSNTFSTPQERQNFDFFRNNTAQSGVTNILDWGFWDQVVLQLVHVEPAIRHGVLALSTLHQNFAAGHDAYSPSGQPYFNDPATLVNFGRAVSHAAKLFESVKTDPSTVKKILTACILFFSIENLIGNPAGARMHLQNGLRIVREEQAWRRHTEGWERNAKSLVSQAISRLEFGAMTLSVSTTPSPFIKDVTKRRAVIVPSKFTSINEAELYLFQMLHTVFALGELPFQSQTIFEVMASLVKAGSWFEQQMFNWETAFDLLAKHLEKLDESTRGRCVLLRVYHKMGLIIGAGSRLPSELGWDALDAAFTQVLDLIESLPILQNKADSAKSITFSLELGIIPPLSLVAFRCRNPEIRRRAIAILRKERRKEMVWESFPAATAIEWIMQLEETGTHPKTFDGRPHELDRVWVVDVDILFHESKLQVKAFLPSDVTAERLRSVEEVLDICAGIGSREGCICTRHGGKVKDIEMESSPDSAFSAAPSSSLKFREFDKRHFARERTGCRGWAPMRQLSVTAADEPLDQEPLGSGMVAGVLEIKYKQPEGPAQTRNCFSGMKPFRSKEEWMSRLA